MTDTPMTDMTAFLERHERRTQRVFITMLCVSLMASAVIFTDGLHEKGSVQALGGLWILILGPPLVLVWLRVGPLLWARSQPRPPGGRFLMNEHDSRGTARVANAGFIFVTGVGAIAIAGQMGVIVPSFDARMPLQIPADWTWRVTTIVMGLLMIYFGNAWPRMPTPRQPDRKPATQTRYKRFYGWLIVVHGLLLALAALLPRPVVIPAIVTVNLSLLVLSVGGVIMYYITVKSPRAS